MLMRPILVMGTPRSGTSLTAGLVAAHGVWTGLCRPADRHNPRGYFENEALRALCWKRIGRTGYPQVLQPEEVEAVLRREGWEGGPWLYKHAPHVLDHWERFRPIRIKVWRDPEAILASHVRRGRLASGARKIIARHHGLLRRLDGIDFHPGRLIGGDDTELRAVVAYCGLDYDPAALDFIERTLWHH